MANVSEEQTNNSPQEFASTRAAIFNTFNKLKKWREDQINQFRSLQHLECQKIMQLSDENQKQFEKLLQNSAKSPELEKSRSSFIENSPVSCASEKNELDVYNTLQDSSITGHLLRCFDDSSQSSISTVKTKVDFAEDSALLTGSQASEFTETNQSENNKMLQEEDTIKCPPGKVKRPFLKKKTGLLRYMSKSDSNTQTSRYKVLPKTNQPKSNQVKRNIQLPQKTLKLKPAIRKTDITSEHNKHIRFNIPSDINLHSEIEDENDVPMVPSSVANTKDTSYDESDKFPNELDKMKDISNLGNESMNSECKELQEFEMLEKCAENSSFNSDSSVVQRLLQADRAKNFKINQKPIPKIKQDNSQMKHVSSKSSSENSIFSSKFGLGKCLEEVQARKQVLQKVISDIDPRIQSLQREISNYDQEALDDSDLSERCSTPIGDLNTENRVLSPVLPDDSNLDLSDLPPPSVSESNIANNCHMNSKCCNVNDVLEDLYSNQNHPEECENSELSQPSNQVINERLKVREKIQELENEIKIYQEHNTKLSLICKERDEILRKLQKEHDDFNKYKEAEKNKLDAEMQEERRQIKRQKETFTRYQKLRKDNPTRKERDELNALRQENGKLQEELKRQKIKNTNDCRRLKTQLDAAEKDRDSLRLENIRLDEQCQDLLASLKTRMKKNKAETVPVLLDKNDEKPTSPVLCYEVSKQKENNTCVPEKESDSESCKDVDQVSQKILTEKRSKSKVRFNLVNESENDKLEYTEVCPEKEIFVESKVQEDYQPEIDSEPVIPEECSKTDPQAINLSIISVSVEAEFKEINLGNKVERIYTSGEREIKFHSGTRKVISADGQSTKFYFYNGDTKEIFPDKRETYKYVNGVTETHFPDGREVTEFPDGQVQRCYPDGQKETIYPNGTTYNIYADKSEEIHSADGNVVQLSADGTETIHFANGQKEIRTPAYKRREFPDGSLKIIYESGRQETRYSNGRIRIKDKEGKVIVDTKYFGVTKG